MEWARKPKVGGNYWWRDVDRGPMVVWVPSALDEVWFFGVSRTLAMSDIGGWFYGPLERPPLPPPEAPALVDVRGVEEED